MSPVSEWSVLRRVLFRRTGWWLVSLPLAPLQLYGLYAAQFVQDEQRGNLPLVIDLLNDWPWWFWLVFALVIINLITLNNASKEIRSANKRVNAVLAARPNIVLDSAPGSNIWYDDVEYPPGSPPEFYEVQAWFLNEPQVNEESSVARNVTAIIEANETRHHGNWNLPTDLAQYGPQG